MKIGPNVFGGSEGVESPFHVFRARTHFRRYRGRQFPVSCFALPDSFSALPRVFGLIFMFCATGLMFGGTEGVGSRFLVLRARTHFRRYRGRWVLFSCFACPESFSTVPRASSPVFIFCVHRLVFCGAECVMSRFHDSRPDSFSVVPGASDPVFIFCAPELIFMFCAPEIVFGGAGVVGSLFNVCAPGLVFGCIEGVWPRLHVLRARTRFRRYGGSRVPFSCFLLLDLFWAVHWASLPVFMFFRPGLVFDGTEGVRSRFHVLHSRIRFRRNLGRRVPFTCFARPDSFSGVSRASLPVFMSSATGHVFGGTEGVGSRFHVLRSETRF
jgi:hypothetical protein